MARYHRHGREKTLLGTTTIWYAFHSKFAILSYFEKKRFSLEKPTSFSKKKQISEDFEKSY